jgi:hypothetical protein
MKHLINLSTFFPVRPLVGLFSFFLFLFSSTHSVAQTTRTWDGSSSSAWTTAANWTPSGVPAAIDHVVITSAGNSPVLAANATVTNFSQTSGTLDLGGKQLTVTGTMSATAGTMQNGLVKKTSTSALTITSVTVNCVLDLTAHTITVNSSRFKQQVTLNKTGGTSTTMSGNVWEAPVYISHTAPDATLTLGGTAADTVLSDMYIYGAGKGILLGSSSGSGNMIFARTNPQLLTITGTVTGKRVTVNKPSGNVELSGTLVIGNYLNLTKGIVRVKAGGLVYVYSGATVSSTSNLSYIDGPVEKAGNQAFTFPVGKNGVYRPISITAPSSSSHRFKAEYFESNSNNIHSHSSKDGSLNYVSTNEYWTLERTNGTSTPKVTLSWDTLTSCGMTGALSTIHVAGWDGSQWKDLGNGATTGNINKGTVQTTSAVTSFSMFTLESDNVMGCFDIDLTWMPNDTIWDNDTVEFTNTSMNFPVSFTYVWDVDNCWNNGNPSCGDTIAINSKFERLFGWGQRVVTLYVLNSFGSLVASKSVSLPVLPIAADWLECNCEADECDFVGNGRFDSWVEPVFEYGSAYYADCWWRVPDNPDYSGECPPMSWTCNSLGQSFQDNLVANLFTYQNPSNDFSVPNNLYSASYSIFEPGLVSTSSTSGYASIVASGLPTTIFIQPHTYLSNKLTDVLHSGQVYSVNFKARLSQRSSYSSRIQVGFVTDELCEPQHADWIDESDFSNIQTVTFEPSGSFLNGFADWHECSVNFTASENWEWFYIGNFTEEGQFPITSQANSIPLTWTEWTGDVWPIYMAAYFIDNVSITAVAPEITQGSSISVCENDLPLTLNATASGTGSNIYTWSASPTDASLSGQEHDMEIEVSPSVTTTYTVTVQGPNGCELTDEIEVTLLYGPTGTITGPDDTCDNDQEYSISFGGTYTKTWVVPDGATIVSGQGSSTIVVDWGALEIMGGIICVTVDDGTCLGTSCIEVPACCVESGEYVNNDTYNPNGSGNDLLGVTNSLSVTAWTITGQTFRINGNLTLNGDLTLDGCHIYMEENASITVNAGHTLTITGQTYIHSCKALWTGILVNNGAEIVVNENSLIEDALYAVFLQNNTTYTIDEAVFNKNYVHMFFYPAGAGSDPSGTITDSYFLCQTTASVAFPPNANSSPNYTTIKTIFGHTDYKTHSGIYRTTGNDNFVLTVGGTGHGNLFENSNFGIYNYEGSLNSYANTFRHMVDDDNCNEDGLFSGLYNCGTGIFSAYTHDVTITDGNHFEDAWQGIFSYYDKESVTVNGNSFLNDFAGVFVQHTNVVDKAITITENDLDRVVIGILCGDNPDAIINIGGEDLGNNIHVIPTIGFLYIGAGIFVSETDPSSETEVNIVENTVTNALTGISVENVLEAAFITDNEISLHDFNGQTGIYVADCIGSYIWQNAVDANFKNANQYGIHVDGGDFASLVCNTTENAGIGIHFENTSDPQGLAKNRLDDNLRGMQLTDCFAFDIGSATTGNDNSWYGNDTYDTYTDNTDASSNTIFYSSAGYPLQPLSNGESFPTYSYDTDDATNPLTWLECPTGVGTQKTDSEELLSQEQMAVLVQLVLNDTVPAVNYPEERAWVRRYHLYQMLGTRPELRTAHPAITDFYDSCHAANAGKLWQAHDALHPAQGNLTASDALYELEGLNMELKPELALRELLGIMADNAADEQYVTDSVLYRAQQHLQNNLGMELVETVGPAITRASRLNEDQYATVAELAEQCPYEYGPAVYMARALLLRNDRWPRVYRNECENSRKRDDEEGGIANASEERSYKLYPNPNTGEFTLSLTMHDHELAAMTVWNISGQEIHAQKLGNGYNTVNLNVAEGLYLYRVTINGSTQWTGKVSITSH